METTTPAVEVAATPKAKKTMVEAAKFEAILKDSGLSYSGQAGFVKVSGAAGRNVYVASTKRVGRVDLSGFTVPDVDGLVDLGPESFGKVEQQVDFSEGRTEEQILATFSRVLEVLKTLPAVEKTSTRKAKEPKAEAKGWSQEVLKNGLTREQSTERLALIRRKAEQMKAAKASKELMEALASEQVPTAEEVEASYTDEALDFVAPSTTEV